VTGTAGITVPTAFVAVANL